MLESATRYEGRAAHNSGWPEAFVSEARGQQDAPVHRGDLNGGDLNGNGAALRIG